MRLNVHKLIETLQTKDPTNYETLSISQITLHNNSVDRDPKAFRSVALIFSPLNVPSTVARWYSSNNERLHEEVKILRELNKFGCPVPVCVDCLEVDGTLVSLESALVGTDLHSFHWRTQLPSKDIFKFAGQCFSDLTSRSLQNSSEQEFADEIDSLVSFGTSKGLLSPSDKLVTTGRESVLRWASKGNLISVICHGDFTLKNIILVNDKPFTFDFEFTRRSQFPVFDWLRLFAHSPTLTEVPLDITPFPQLISHWQNIEAPLKDLLCFFEILRLKNKCEVLPAYHQNHHCDLFRKRIANYHSNGSILSTPIFSEESLGAVTLTKELQGTIAKILTSEGDAVNSSPALEVAEKVQELDLRYNIAIEASKLSKKKLEQSITSLQGLQERLSRAEETIHNLRNEVWSKDKLLDGVVKSLSFKVGRLFTSPLRLLRRLTKPVRN